MKTGSVKKAVLAYSGGLDTSIIIPWLKENYGCEVIAVAGDVGQGGGELDGLKEKAVKTGASKCYVENLQAEFVNEFIFPTLKAGAKYEGQYLLGTSFARPVIAKRVVEIAKAEGADAIVHGCTGKGNDQVRFELTIKAFAPEMKIIAPWREWDLKSREDEIAILELGVSPEKAPDQPECIEIAFEQGVPVSLNGRKMDGVALIKALNQLGGKHGVGILDMVENRLCGMKSRGVYETPGGAILYAAHETLEQLTIDRDTLSLKQQLAIRYAELVYFGLWYTPLREALDAFFAETQRTVTGTAGLKLYKGNIIPHGMTSPYSLYDEKLASFGESDYNQKDAEGFINLFGLPVKVCALARKK